MFGGKKSWREGSVSDFAIYWKNIVRDRELFGFGPSKPLADWRTNSKWLFRSLRAGDRLWFFACGRSCGGEVATAAYLVNVFEARCIIENAGDDPDYPSGEFRYTVWAERELCRWVDPPMLGDEFVRPAGHELSEHIGNLLQGPRRLAEPVAAALLERLRGSAAGWPGAISWAESRTGRPRAEPGTAPDHGGN
jgi:hypothetical protein